MKKITFLFLSLFVLTNYCFGQNPEKLIFFYKPYTDSSETNLYRDTTVKFDYDTQYYNLKESNVSSEVEKAISHNDFRFIGISGNSYVFPGLDGGYKKNKDGTKTFSGLDQKFDLHFKKYGFKAIKGTSDFININDLPLQSIASEYAKKYNLLLFGRMEGKAK